MTEEQLKRAAEIHRDIGEIRQALYTLDGDHQATALRQFYESVYGGRECRGEARRDDYCRIAVTAIKIAMQSELARLKEEAEKL